mgnify:CR=1 FL=1
MWFYIDRSVLCHDGIVDSLRGFAGYFFGDLPFVQQNLKLLLLAIIVISVLPAVIEVVRARLKRD